MLKLGCYVCVMLKPKALPQKICYSVFKCLDSSEEKCGLNNIIRIIDQHQTETINNIFVEVCKCIYMYVYAYTMYVKWYMNA